MVNETDIQEDAINPDRIIADLQASFDNERYDFTDIEDALLQQWRNEMDSSWRYLVEHTMEVWDYGWHHALDAPDRVRAEWLFRRKESPFLSCSVEQCRRVIHDMLPTAHREPEQFLLFMMAVLTQGSSMWPYSECKAESEMDRPN